MCGTWEMCFYFIFINGILGGEQRGREGERTKVHIICSYRTKSFLRFSRPFSLFRISTPHPTPVNSPRLLPLRALTSATPQLSFPHSPKPQRENKNFVHIRFRLYCYNLQTRPLAPNSRPNSPQNLGFPMAKIKKLVHGHCRKFVHFAERN